MGMFTVKYSDSIVREQKRLVSAGEVTVTCPCQREDSPLLQSDSPVGTLVRVGFHVQMKQVIYRHLPPAEATSRLPPTFAGSPTNQLGFLAEIIYKKITFCKHTSEGCRNKDQKSPTAARPFFSIPSPWSMPLFLFSGYLENGALDEKYLY